MIIEIKYDNQFARFGTWFSLDKVDYFIREALRHNQYNYTSDLSFGGMRQIFNHIIKEFVYFKEFDKGHTISDKDVEVSYELLYHNDYGLMAERKARFSSQPVRIILEE